MFLKEAITTASGKSIVRVKADKADAIEKEVEIGVSNGRIVEIKSGLKEGDIIILPQS